MIKKIIIGTGAGYSGDRIEPAVDLAEQGNLDYLIFECLAERTIALAQKRKLADLNSGFDPMLKERLRMVLPPCAKNKTRIITNMGAANPKAAGKIVFDLLKEWGLTHLKVGVVLGDDVLDRLLSTNFSILNKTKDILKIKEKIISANVYLGTSQIMEALKNGSDIIITGRVCDSSLFLAPMMFEFDWKEDDWDKIGKGIAIAHLMECGAQVTGGYFADPGYKDVVGLANLGFPIAEVFENGNGIITKLPGSGGEVSIRTCKEQILYEVQDPSSYITADGIADFTKLRFEEIEKDMVKISGGSGKPRPNDLKVLIGFRNGYVGEAQISYGGEGAFTRAEFAANILKERIKILGLKFEDFKIDYIGVNSLWPDTPHFENLKEVRLRVIGRAYTEEDAEKLTYEVEALYTNGPAGGGGVSKRIEESTAIISAFISREDVIEKVEFIGEENEED